METASDKDPSYYRIGTVGKPWGEEEREQWKAQTTIQRSFKTDFLDPIDEFRRSAAFRVVQYGHLPIDPKRYPLYAVQTRDWDDETKPSVCITGCVHGYEKSGGFAALRFLQKEAAVQQYVDKFNIVVFPCVSPWSYEHNERWNPQCKDPNRCFLRQPDGQPDVAAIPETAAVIRYLDNDLINVLQWTCHLDLHETTDSDEIEYMPARAAAEKGEPYQPETIPDGFFLYVNDARRQRDWCDAIVDAVREVMPIAQPLDRDGEPLPAGHFAVGLSNGVVPLNAHECVGDGMSVTDATYQATTELYPDSANATDEICIEAQVTAITAALDRIIEMNRRAEVDRSQNRKPV